MPQLAKGGKFVFGWSRVSERGEVVLPPEAAREYGLKTGDKLVLMSGSRASGGFGLSSERLLRHSLLAVVLERLRAAGGGKTPVRVSPQRFACRARLGPKARFRLSPGAQECFGVKPGDHLLIIRSSDIAIGMAHHGPLIKHARRFPEIPVY